MHAFFVFSPQVFLLALNSVLTLISILLLSFALPLKPFLFAHSALFSVCVGAYTWVNVTLDLFASQNI